MNTSSAPARSTAVLALILLPLAAAAHPGHAWWDAGPVHALTSPWHLGVLAAAGVLLFLAARWIQRPFWARSLRCAGLACWLVLLALWSLPS